MREITCLGSQVPAQTFKSKWAGEPDYCLGNFRTASKLELRYFISHQTTVPYDHQNIIKRFLTIVITRFKTRALSKESLMKFLNPDFFGSHLFCVKAGSIIIVCVAT